MMAPAARPPMIPAAIRPPRASAGCGAATAATASVAATARAVRVLVILIMASLLSILRAVPLNGRSLHLLRFSYATVMSGLALSSDFTRECVVNGTFRNGVYAAFA